MPMHVKSALIIDDDNANRSIWELILSERGYHVQYAADIASSLPHIGPSVGLYLVDIHLPDGPGADLVKSIREQAPESVLLIVSMDDDSAVIRTAMQYGGNVYIVKPASPSMLRELLTEIDQGSLTASSRVLINRNGRRAYTLA